MKENNGQSCLVPLVQDHATLAISPDPSSRSFMMSLYLATSEERLFDPTFFLCLEVMGVVSARCH